MTPGEIKQHLEWMKEEDFATSTINASLGFISSFYEWCVQNRIDPSCPQGFNPAAEVARIKRVPYEDGCVWSAEEVDTLLDFLRRDQSPLGRRDYSFFLLRLHSGVPLKCILNLRWGQLEPRTDGLGIHWKPGIQPVETPLEVYEAIRVHLEVSGRYAGIKPDSYVFVPLAMSSLESPRTEARDWMEDKPISAQAILSSLKLYGQQLGMENDMLNLITLRRTAMRMKIDQGASLDEMQRFLASSEEPKQIRYRLKRLQLMEESGWSSNGASTQANLPVRGVSNFKEGENTTHGLYARGRDKMAVREVMLENISGMEGEIVCLRKLMRGILECDQGEDRLVQTYSQATQRLKELLKASKPVKKHKKEQWAEGILTMLDAMAIENGHEPVSDSIRAEALGLATDEGGGGGMITEEIAVSRLMLRNVYRRAMEVAGGGEYLRLVDLYGLGCVRLAKLLVMETDDGGRLVKYLEEEVDRAIREVREEMGLSP